MFSAQALCKYLELEVYEPYLQRDEICYAVSRGKGDTYKQQEFRFSEGDAALAIIERDGLPGFLAEAWQLFLNAEDECCGQRLESWKELIGELLHAHMLLSLFTQTKLHFQSGAEVSSYDTEVMVGTSFPYGGYWYDHLYGHRMVQAVDVLDAVKLSLYDQLLQDIKNEGKRKVYIPSLQDELVVIIDSLEKVPEKTGMYTPNIHNRGLLGGYEKYCVWVKEIVSEKPIPPQLVWKR